VALPPTIPTSFVPKQPLTPTARRRLSGTNPFLTLSYFVIAIAVIGCGAVFAYQYYLQGVAKKKANDVIAAQNKIDQSTVSEFIHLRDRFSAAKGILDHQVALSQFFDVLERVTLQSVSFHNLKLTVAEDRHAQVEMTGSARSFNALAAQSAALASEKRIKRAIFSNISAVGGSVSFNLTAEIDPTLIVRPVKVTTTPPPASIATTTPAAAPATATTTP
jgi:hypothetical protein